MKPIKVLHMYADILDLYGDSGNMEILSYRCQMRQIPFVIRCSQNRKKSELQPIWAAFPMKS